MISTADQGRSGIDGTLDLFPEAESPMSQPTDYDKTQRRRLKG
jgi:hypothetical protein